MKSVVLVLLLLGWVTVSVIAAPEEAPPAQRVEQPFNVPGLLEAGRKAKRLPDGMVVRVKAKLWNPGDFSRFEETWEFTSEHVHRVVIDYSAQRPAIYQRVQSLPFTSTDLCKELQDGKLLKIAEEEGTGDPILFVGTDCKYGHRSIEIFANGESLLFVGESCASAGFAKTDAEAFAVLYEQLASQAREAFQSSSEKPKP